MSDTVEMAEIDDVPRGTRKRRIAFVAEQFVPPVTDGSTYVYKNWIDFLAERYQLYAVFFTLHSTDTAEAERYLSERCAAHLILPGHPDSPSWKVMRAMSRLATGALFAPRWIEELGRGEIRRAIARFAARYQPELFLVSKLASIPLFGVDNLCKPESTLILDMHDDFIRRDVMDRRVLTELLTKFPALRGYARYRDMRLRHLLTRLVAERARAQEDRLHRLFDCVLASAPGEHNFYRARLPETVPCELLGWPPPKAEGRDARPSPARAAARYHAGFIGGDYPFNLEGVIFFCTRILPLIRDRCPDFKFLVAGHVAAPLALLAPAWPGVEYCGFVPTVQRFYEQVRVSVVPILSGTGVSVKTLEALNFDTPVVSTLMGARGLAGRHHPFLAITDEPKDFARHVLSFSTERSVHDKDFAEREPAMRDRASAEFQVAFDRLLRTYGPRQEGAQAAAVGERPRGTGAA